MQRKTAEFIVSIPTGGDTLRGKFRVKVKLTYREILEMDSVRRQLQGPQGGDVDPLAALVASSLAKINTHIMDGDCPSWWKDANNGLDFDDLNIILEVAKELNKVEKAHLDDLKKLSDKAAELLKTSME